MSFGTLKFACYSCALVQQATIYISVLFVACRCPIFRLQSGWGVVMGRHFRRLIGCELGLFQPINL